VASGLRTAQPYTEVEPRTKSALVVAIILTMIAGLIQSPLADVAPGLPARDLLDDALLALALVISLPRIGKSPLAASTLIFAWLIAVATSMAAVNNIPTGDEFVIARQIAVPAVLIYLGMQLTPPDWRTVTRAGIVLGIINACYMLLELAGINIFDPNALLSAPTADASTPGYYNYWIGEGLPTIARLGGIFLNPPVSGIMVAAALVALFHTREFPLRRTWLVILSATTILCFARGGWLIAAAGILIPVLVRRFGRIGSVALIVPVGLYAWTELAAHGESSSHSDGLASGVQIALGHPWGVGFGTFGNHAYRLTWRSQGGESLAGIALAALGFFALASLIILFVVLFRQVAADDGGWEAALGIGVVVAALLSESAGALNATTLAWLAVGVAVRASHRAARARRLLSVRRTAVRRRRRGTLTP
jgi:hypothetical protein